MSSQQSPPIKLNNASFCRVLEGYANDVEKHGRPLDNGLPTVLRDCVERLKSDEAKLEELQGGVYCTNRRVAGEPCGELTARIQERGEALSKLDRYRSALERIIEAWDGDSESMHNDPAVIAREALSDE